MAWYKFITTTPGDGSVLTFGTNMMLTLFVNSWVTKELSLLDHRLLGKMKLKMRG